tara:strand:+ start:411 stop:1043 length:633 start_codon:yes stop_codon:yes gene_type:complete
LNYWEGLDEVDQKWAGFRWQNILSEYGEANPFFLHDMREQASREEFLIQKFWMSIHTRDQKVNILNSGLGFWSVPFAAEKNAKSIHTYDMCPLAEKLSWIANKTYSSIHTHHKINTVFDTDSIELDADVWINTSCEHTYPVNDIIPKGATCVLSGNNLKKRGHINLINSLMQLKVQAQLSKIQEEKTLVLDYEDELGKRQYEQYMIIGIK